MEPLFLIDAVDRKSKDLVNGFLLIQSCNIVVPSHTIM